MLPITEEFINSKAVNTDSVKNGKSLVQKGNFVKLWKDKEETIIFGECQGSGSSNYRTSADFLNADAPVFRCSCPSRQFPCKHSIGIMYAYANGKNFEIADIPEDILKKREKIEKKEENREEEKESESKPKAKKKTNTDAAKKKIKAQLEGLELLKKMVDTIMVNGFSSIDSKTIKDSEAQIKELGNYYIPGVQILMKEFYSVISSMTEKDSKEIINKKAMEKLLIIYNVYKKGKEYLEKVASDQPVTETEIIIEEFLGRAWQLSELKEKGFVQENVELIQLSFDVLQNNIEKEFVDLGIWINMADGTIVKTMNYRPFKALNYIKDEDSFYKVLKTREMFIYPSVDSVRRVRWENFEAREIEEGDYKKVTEFASSNYGELLKNIKNQIKNPLGNKNPYALIKFKKIGISGESLVIESEDGVKIPVKDGQMWNNSSYFLGFLNQDEAEGQVLLVTFIPDIEEGMLYVQPLSLITDKKILRFAF